MEPETGNREFAPRYLSVATTVAFFILVSLSLLPRLADFHASLLGPHFFRQTQTAFTIWSLLEHNASPFSYQTPLFGPPWQVPFEFPVFQLTAAGLVRLGVSSIDQAARITNLFYFYCSAFILFFLSRRVLNSSRIAGCILLVYLWSPFDVFWSRTCMIDFTSVCFALAYLYCFESWLNSHGGKMHWTFAATIVMGILGYLTKGSTMPAVLPCVAYFSFRALFPTFSLKSFVTSIREVIQNKKSLSLNIGAAVVVPALCGYGWTLYTDGIKESSPFTEILALTRMRGFIRGAWAQPLDLEGWAIIFSRLRTDVFPYFLILLVPAGVLVAYRHSSSCVAFVSTMLLGAAMTMILFFNLYQVHDYYLMAVTANLSIAAGGGAHYFIFILPRERGWLSVFLIPPLFLSFSSGLAGLEKRVADIRKQYEYVMPISDALRRATDPSEYVVVKDFDWNSGILYYAHRRGFMLWPETAETEATYNFLKEKGFSTIVYKETPTALLSKWRHYRVAARVGDWQITKVSDEELDSLANLPHTVAPGETKFVIDVIHTTKLVASGAVVKIPAELPEFRVAGWAIDEPAGQAASAVYLTIDGKLYQTNFPVERDDVAEYFKNSAYRFSGFDERLSTADLGKGRHELSIKILTNDGTAYYAPDTRIFLNIE